MEKAFKSMQNTYKLRLKKRFYDADDNSVVHDVFKQNYIGFLPYRAKNGSVILVVKLGEFICESLGCQRVMKANRSFSLKILFNMSFL